MDDAALAGYTAQLDGFHVEYRRQVINGPGVALLARIFQEAGLIMKIEDARFAYDGGGLAEITDQAGIVMLWREQIRPGMAAQGWWELLSHVLWCCNRPTSFVEADLFADLPGRAAR